MVRCPACSCDDCRGSRLRWFDFLPLLVLLRPRRCRGCARRFWRPLVWF